MTPTATEAAGKIDISPNTEKYPATDETANAENKSNRINGI
jgi:hypothetical protein